MEMAALLEMLQMDEGEFAKFFQSQMELSSRFSGPLFSILREAYGGGGSEVLKGSILQFLKPLIVKAPPAAPLPRRHI